MANSSLFTNLKKLFSSSSVITIDADGEKKVFDVDERQQTNLSHLRDRYTKIQKSFFQQAGQGVSMAYQQVRRELFRDYDSMDQDPIISSALDIYADECLGPDTKIPLLNGQTRTIKELFDKNIKDFWLYGLDEKGNFKPIKADKVAYNGKKRVKKITLEDGTIIFATDEHIWVDNDLKEIKTKDLTPGLGLYTLPTKRSSHRTMSGYNMIKHGDKFEFVHRIIGEIHDELKKQKPRFNKPVLHHISFDKLNNDPEFLKYMDVDEHIQLHADRNKEMWEQRRQDEKWMRNFRRTIKKAHEAYWDEDKKQVVADRQRRFMTSFYNTLTSTERKERYGHAGPENGMYQKGYKLQGKRNGRWIDDINRVDDLDLNTIIDILFEEYDEQIQNARQVLANHEFIFNDSEYYKLCNAICDELNIKTIKQLHLAKAQYYNPKKLHELRNCVVGYEKNPLRNYSRICKSLDISTKEMNNILRYNEYTNFTDFVNSSNHRIQSVSDNYIEMDVYDIVNAGDNHIYAIETNDGGKLYTHNCTTLNEYSDILEVNSSNDKVKESLENLFYDVLNIEFNLWPWVRNLTKYGDMYLFLEIAEKTGIVNVKPFSVYNVERIEDSDPDNPNYVKFELEDDPLGKGEYENYEIAHFRLLSDMNFLPYGKAMIENGRRLWKQLHLMEDAMLIHRIMRAPEKRAFYIDIGNIKSQEVDNYMEQIINKMKKVPFVDRRTGDYNLKYNMQNLTEDFYLPVRGGDSGTQIDTVRGLEYTAIEDIDYLKNKLFAALKIPRAYLGYEENVSGKATLAAEDVRFARTIERIQRIVVSELTKIAIVHLYAIGIPEEEIANFELKLTNPSTIYEQEKISLWSEKIRLADDMKRSEMFSTDWIYENVFNLSEDEIEKERARLITDFKSQFRYEQIKMEGNDPAAPEPEPVDVEEQLSNFDESGNKRQPNPRKPGRPKEGGDYRSQDHALGRDPLGDKENHSERKREKRTPEINNRLAREAKARMKNTPKVLQERFSMLDEENIIDTSSD